MTPADATGRADHRLQMPSPATAEVHYRVHAPVRGAFPGHHRSSRGESGFEFRGHANLIDAPDPRRLDLHASLRDPFGGWMVRVYSQRMSLPVTVVADVSGSMGFAGERRKLDVVADLVDSLGWSAWRTGDSFGAIGCDSVVRPDLLLPQTRSRGAGAPLAHALRTLVPTGDSANGLRQAHLHLPRQKALVFLVSDFHFPVADIDVVLKSLTSHDVVPVVVWDDAEFRLPAERGLAEATDAESGRHRTIWWRPALRARWAGAHANRRTELQQLFQRRQARPLFLEHGFDAEAVTRHFQT